MFCNFLKPKWHADKFPPAISEWEMVLIGWSKPQREYIEKEMGRKKAVVMESEMETAGCKIGVWITVQLSPPATAALHTESFYVQVPAVLHREPNPQRALTASGRWRRDTINRLSTTSLYTQVMSMWISNSLKL